MARRREAPYIWVTWLTKLLVGENQCEWATWFKANHESSSYAKMPSTFDATTWQLEHTELLSLVRSKMEMDGRIVTTENQNSFTLRGRTAVLGGKPDLVSVSGESGTIVDVKTGQPLPSHHVQLLIYMYALPRALPRYKGITFDGKVVYPDHEDHVPSAAVDATFVNNLSELITRMATQSPARKVPSGLECGFCNITVADCPDRIEGEDTGSVGGTDDF